MEPASGYALDQAVFIASLLAFDACVTYNECYHVDSFVRGGEMFRLFRWPVIALSVLVATPSIAQLGIDSLNHTHSPLLVVSDPLNPHYHFSVGRFGRIRTIKDWVYQAEDFAVFPPESLYFPGEGGVLSMAFSPKHFADRFVYVSYLRADQVHVVSRFERIGDDPGELDLSSEYPIIEIQNYGDFHIGGHILFDESGLLHIGKGDGSEYPRSQNPNVLNGKMLRIDVGEDDFPLDPNRNYRIPPDNHFLAGEPISALPEIMHFGLRNPWRFSIDHPSRSGSGAMLIGDVGADTWEEIDYVPPKTIPLNFGWPNSEGKSTFDPNIPLAFGPLTLPIHTLRHNDYRAIVGGHIYRGTTLGPEYYGRYFFGDVVSMKLLSGKVWINPDTLRASFSDMVDHTADLLQGTGFSSLGNIFSIDLDSQQNLIVVSWNRLHRIRRDTPAEVFTLVGSMAFEGLSDWERRPPIVTFEYRNELGAPILDYQVGVNKAGTFTVPIPAGRNSLSIKAGTWLRRTISYDTSEELPDWCDLIFKNGDAMDDNEIDIADYAIVSAAFGASPSDPHWERRADLNRDDEVDIADFAIVSANFGLIGDQ